MMLPDTRKLAVLISVYNDQIGIEKTLKSIDGLGLTIWVIDDGSFNPIKLSDNYKSKVFLVRLDKNLGLIHALNHGLDLIERDCREYVFRIDAGDEFSYSGVMSRYQRILETNVGILGGSTLFIEEKSGSKFKVEKKSRIPSKWFPLRVNYIHSGVIFKITDIRYDKDNVYCEDIFMFYDIEKRFGGITVIDDPVLVYQGGSGISTDKRKVQLRSLRRNIVRRKDLSIAVAYLAIVKTYIQEYFVTSKSLEMRLKSLVLRR